jgi:hypothetical protein
MQTGEAFISTNDDPGLLSILFHDPAAHRATGTFSVTVHDAEAPTTHDLEGSFDVTYSIE